MDESKAQDKFTPIHLENIPSAKPGRYALSRKWFGENSDLKTFYITKEITPYKKHYIHFEGCQISLCYLPEYKSTELNTPRDRESIKKYEVNILEIMRIIDQLNWAYQSNYCTVFDNARGYWGDQHEYFLSTFSIMLRGYTFYHKYGFLYCLSESHFRTEHHFLKDLKLNDEVLDAIHQKLSAEGEVYKNAVLENPERYCAATNHELPHYPYRRFKSDIKKTRSIFDLANYLYQQLQITPNASIVSFFQRIVQKEILPLLHQKLIQTRERFISLRKHYFHQNQKIQTLIESKSNHPPVIKYFPLSEQ